MRIADRAPAVDQHDEAVLTVEECIDEFMNAAGVTTERFSKRHDLTAPRREYAPRRWRVSCPPLPIALQCCDQPLLNPLPLSR
jgi:hypothetical protein